MPDQEKALTEEQSTALFVTAEKKMQSVKSARESLAKAETALSDSVKDIHDKIGPGPFNWRDRDLKISKRKDTYSLKPLEQRKTTSIAASS